MKKPDWEILKKAKEEKLIVRVYPINVVGAVNEIVPGNRFEICDIERNIICYSKYQIKKVEIVSAYELFKIIQSFKWKLNYAKKKMTELIKDL